MELWKYYKMQRTTKVLAKKKATCKKKKKTKYIYKILKDIIIHIILNIYAPGYPITRVPKSEPKSGYPVSRF
jgi:hypothetical protein